MNSTFIDDVDEYFMSMAVFSAFIDRGIRTSPAFYVLGHTGSRARELVERTSAYLPMAVRIERAILELDGPRPQCARTLEEAVCVPFGAWYIQHCYDQNRSPSDAACRHRLANSIVEHFAKGQTPAHAWAIVRAAKCVEPSIVLPEVVVKESINWEWAQRVPTFSDTRPPAGHPQYPREAWLAQGDLMHVRDYWAWVDYRLQAAHVMAQYQELATASNVFIDLLRASEVRVDGRVVTDILLRRDLIGQECVDILPSNTAFTAGLLSALPYMQQAFAALDANFELATWIARPVADFISEYVRTVDSDNEAVVSGVIAACGTSHPFALTLRQLWRAEWQGAGVWVLDDGTVLRTYSAEVCTPPVVSEPLMTMS